MARQRIEHTFNCDADTYWSKIFFEEEYNRRMFLEAMDFDSWKIVSQDETDGEIVRVVDATPKMPDLPGPLKKLAESGVGYRETATFNKKTQRLRLEIRPASLGGKLKIGGELYCEAAGEGKCRRVYDSNVEAKIFGVGGLLEKRITQEMRDSYAQAAKFTNEYIAEKEL